MSQEFGAQAAQMDRIALPATTMILGGIIRSNRIRSYGRTGNDRIARIQRENLK